MTIENIKTVIKSLNACPEWSLMLNANTYVLRGNVAIDGVSKEITLFTIINPFKTLKHAWSWTGEAFKAVPGKFLALRSHIDVLLFDGFLYFFNMNGEKLFDMERAYKQICDKKIEEVLDAQLVNDEDCFRQFASSGFNPRKFVSYNKNRVDKLKSDMSFHNLAVQKFGILCDNNGAFDSTDKKNVNRLVKFICGKGMIDPTDEKPVEVDGSRAWGKNMPKPFIFSMFFLSFAPLWLCTAFIDCMNLYKDPSSPCTEIIGLGLIIVGFFISGIETFRVLKREGGQNYTKYNVEEAAEDTFSTTAYLLSNTLPLFAFDFTRWESTVTFLIVFSVLFILCVIHNRYDCNVCLELFGYRLYKCWLNREGETVDDAVVLIHRKVLHKNDEVAIRMIGSELYLGYVVEPKPKEGVTQ